MKTQSKQLIAISFIIVCAILFVNMQDVDLFQMGDIGIQGSSYCDEFYSRFNIGDTLEALHWNEAHVGETISITVKDPDGNTWFRKSMVAPNNGDVTMTVGKQFQKTGQYRSEWSYSHGPYGQGVSGSGHGWYVDYVQPELSVSFTIYPTTEIGPNDDITISYDIKNTGEYDALMRVRIAGRTQDIYDETNIAIERGERITDTFEYPYSQDFLDWGELNGEYKQVVEINTYVTAVLDTQDIQSSWTAKYNRDERLVVAYAAPILTVSTNPGGCDVTLSGGATKNSGPEGIATFENLQAKSYTVTVSRENYETTTQTVNMETSQSISVSLAKSIFKLTVSTPYPDCTVKVQGAKTFEISSGTGGVAIFEDLPKGSYTVFVAKSGYATETRTANLIDRDLVLSITTLSKDAYELTIVTYPGNCDVTINAVTKNSGTTGAIFEDIPKGIVDIEVAKGSQSTTKKHYVTKDDTVVISLYTEEEGEDGAEGGTEPTPEQPTGKTPGFELLFLIIAIGIVMIIVKRRKK